MLRVCLLKEVERLTDIVRGVEMRVSRETGEREMYDRERSGITIANRDNRFGHKIHFKQQMNE